MFRQIILYVPFCLKIAFFHRPSIDRNVLLPNLNIVFSNIFHYFTLEFGLCITNCYLLNSICTMFNFIVCYIYIKCIFILWLHSHKVVYNNKVIITFMVYTWYRMLREELTMLTSDSKYINETHLKTL